MRNEDAEIVTPATPIGANRRHNTTQAFSGKGHVPSQTA
jgi:hypothetical protein